MKVLLIGGTGVLSADIAHYIVQCDMELYLLNRGTRKEFMPVGANLIRADVRNSKDVKEKLQNLYFDVVIDFLSYNLSQLKNTLSSLEARYSQFVFISSATIYNNKILVGQNITEDMPIGNKKWQYVVDKINCEKFLAKHFLTKKSVYTIIRPYVTYNKTRIPYALIPFGYYQWSIIDRILKGKPIIMWDDGSAVCSLTDAEDFAKGIVGVFGKTEAYNEIFHITSSEIVKWEDVLLEIGLILNKIVNIIYIPSDFIVEYLPEYKGILLDDKATNYHFDNSKILKLVPEFNSCTNLQEGMKKTVNFYLENVDKQLVDYAWNGKMDYLISEYAKSVHIKIDKKSIVINKSATLTLKDKMKYYLYRMPLTNRMMLLRERIKTILK